MKKNMFIVLLVSILTACGGDGGGGLQSTSVPTSTPPTPTIATYTIGGTITGLTGTVILQNNSGDNLSETANGAFMFPSPLANNDAYLVTVLTQPANQNCSVSLGSAFVSSGNVNNIVVACVPLCTNNQVLNASNICVNPTCTNNQVLNENNSCVNPTCTNGQTLTESNICVNPTCTNNQVLNVNNVCVNPTCTNGKILNIDNVCVLPPPISCTLPNVLGKNGTCVIPQPVSCTSPQVLNEDGHCETPKIRVTGFPCDIGNKVNLPDVNSNGTDIQNNNWFPISSNISSRVGQEFSVGKSICTLRQDQDGVNYDLSCAQ